MARISQYENENTAKSEIIASKIIKTPFDVSELDAFQMRYGISNKRLSEMSGHVESSIAEWKNGKLEMPFRIKQHFSLLFAHFKSLDSEL